MSDTPRLSLPLVAADQAQKHVTVNEALAFVDALLALAITATRSDPPSSPTEGEAFLVAAGASGEWTGAEGRLALRIGGGWTFREPPAGLVALMHDERRLAVHHPGLGFVPALAVGETGAWTADAVVEEEVALAGTFVETAMDIPDRALVLAVSTRTTEAVTGASGYDCGIAGETTKFGGALGSAPGSVNIGVVGPTAFYAATPVRLTAVGSAFTGGAVRVAVHMRLFHPPAG